MADNIAGTDTPAATASNVPDKPALEGLEPVLARRWHEQGIYRFNPDTSRGQVYSIDTPPPTASGSLHVGHMFSYTQTDVLARYQRMLGKNVFYPMGWDDNGLPTERRVQNYYGVRCNPSLRFDADFAPPAQPAKNERDFVEVSRGNFIRLCEELAVEDEKVFENLFSTLGLSVDWDLTYRTIDDTSRAVSQRAFLANLAAGDAYMAEAPTLWDVTFRTAVAQAELEDRERPGAFHRISFHRPDGEKVYIETTRPELIPACVALVAHPDDERYQALFGSTVFSPLFGVEVEVKAHPLAKPEKGSGLVMVCTFGDLTDVTWWRELQLPTRAIVGRDGRILADTPAWITGSAVPAYEAIAGKTIFSAKEAVVAALRESGDLDGEPKPVLHSVNFYEKGDKPLEVVTSRQWYLRNGGRDADRRTRLIARGKEIEFHPSFMRSRYENWVEGLNGDWLVSRQRFFGVPIPVWYRLDAAGNPDYEAPILPADDQLPVDPAAEPAPGFDESMRAAPGGFIGDADVLDTWATSSLTPQIVGGWSRDDELFSKVFPFDLRPQGHDIIRTWLFSSAVRADALQDAAPWKHAAISGWILDPDRKKMSKSKGNVVVPTDALDDFGADAVRYWAASAKLGADTAYEVGQMKIGRRLAIKLLNASKFVLNLGVTESSVLRPESADAAAVISNALDWALLTQLADVVDQATTAFEGYDYARALALTESFFWTFTDDYVELVKDRAYGAAGKEEQASVLATLATTLDTLLRLFAPFIPFATEEVWSWWRNGSIHRASWPTALRLATDGGARGSDATMLATLGDALSGIRKAKSEAKVKQRTQVLSAIITAPERQLVQLAAGLGDLLAAGNARDIALTEGPELSVSAVVLAPLEDAAKA
ncbi:valine--tRNA ligase [Paenarthrobacter sp. Z7-10]|uniref:valine--tRNA ligase n=1 Tax=Paenarthrobacter sp. Z7-10 TaxID=2787635 RepID=UPI0022A91D78|nr:valine--tRNA ligase [Paenarthrobacter sp. Z7-10]MCZ2403950.1 valine--tRNA ligase [Paenarthrobacter sp. Z7-10]